MEEANAAEERNDEIVEAVVIEVADGAAHAVTGLVEADRGRHIGEGAVAVVAVQLVGGERSFSIAGEQRAALDAEEVGPAVVVVIDPADAAAHRLGDVHCRRGAVEVDEIDPRVGSGVDEPRHPRRRSRGLLPHGGRIDRNRLRAATSPEGREEPKDRGASDAGENALTISIH